MKKRILISLVVFAVSLVAVTATNLLSNSRPLGVPRTCVSCYKRDRAEIPLQTRHYEKKYDCNDCNGIGKKNNVKCYTCNGKGVVYFLLEEIFCPRCGHIYYKDQKEK